MTLAQPTVDAAASRVEADLVPVAVMVRTLVVEYEREFKRAASFPEHVLLHGARNSRPLRFASARPHVRQ
jgi:hypothetical protein